MIQEYLNLIFGDASPAFIAAGFTFAIMGVILSLRLQIVNRDRESDRTPKHFSWSFFWLDNIKRLVTTLILIFVALRFTEEWMGAKTTMWLAFLIGLSVDKFAQFLKNQNILGKKLQQKNPD